MIIELEEHLISQLQTIAHEQKRDLDKLLQEAVEQYIERQSEEVQFEDAIDRIMSEHDWLLSELAKP